MKPNRNLRVALGGLLLASPLLGQPTITLQPTNQSVSLNASARFRVTATSSGGAMAYQWWFKDAALDTALNPSAGKSTLLLSNVTEVMAGGYWVVVADDHGSVTSGVATLSVDPTFTKVTEGAPVTDLGVTLWSSWSDYDGDGDADLAVTRYKTDPSALYRNNGNGTFSAVSGVPWATRDTWSNGTWADFDNDGRPDFLVQRDSRPLLICFNNGDGTFSPREYESQTPYTTAVVDYNRDGFLDLHTGTRLYRGLGERSFQRVMPDGQTPGTLPALPGYAPTWGDYDDDGWPDVYAASFPSSWGRLFHNTGSQGFEEVANLVTGSNDPVIVGAWGDYDNDGDLDLVVVRYGGTSLVYRNLGNGDFEEALEGPAISGSQNSASWADYDNDGDLDLFLTAFGPANSLFRNDADGTFSRIASGSIVTDRPTSGAGSYTGLWFDYDNDGFLDLYVGNGEDSATVRTPNFLYRNNGNGNSWLRVRLTGTVSNRDAIGARVRVQARLAGQPRWQRRDVSGGDVYNGHHLVAHFGLGDATQADIVRIEWPSGIVQELRNVPAKQILTVTEPARLQALDAGRVRIQCWKGQKFEAEVSNDLAGWTSLGLFTNETGTLEFTDPDVGRQPYRYYRAVSR